MRLFKFILILTLVGCNQDEPVDLEEEEWVPILMDVPITEWEHPFHPKSGNAIDVKIAGDGPVIYRPGDLSGESVENLNKLLSESENDSRQISLRFWVTPETHFSEVSGLVREALQARISEIYFVVRNRGGNKRFGLIKIHNPLVDGGQREHFVFRITQEDEIFMHTESDTLRPLSDRELLEVTMLFSGITEASGGGFGQVLLQVHSSASILRFADVVSCFADKGIGVQLAD